MPRSVRKWWQTKFEHRMLICAMVGATVNDTPHLLTGQVDEDFAFFLSLVAIVSLRVSCEVRSKIN